MIPDYILSQLEDKAIAAGQWLEDWRITPMQHRANILKMWIRRPERAKWYEVGNDIGDYCTAASPETIRRLIAEIRELHGEV